MRPHERLSDSFVAPTRWADAAALFAEDPANSAFAAGATYLMWRAAHGEALPSRLISLHRIPGAGDIADSSIGTSSIGALATLRSLEHGPRRGALRALSMAASVTAGPSVRTLATLGGNLASGFPQADLVPPLLALDCQVEFSDGDSASLADVVAHGLQTDRLLTRVTYDAPGHEWTGASVKLCRRGMDLSVGLASAVLRVHGDEITEARIAVGSFYDRPTRLTELESALIGADTSPETLREVVEVIGITGRKFAADLQSDASYRAAVIGPVVARALTLAARLGPTGIPVNGEAFA